MTTHDQEDKQQRARREARVRSRVITTAATYCVLSLAGAVSFVLPESVPAHSVAEIPRPVYGPSPTLPSPDPIADPIAGAMAGRHDDDPEAARTANIR